MSKLKKIVKEDFISKTNCKFEIDSSSLEINENVKVKKKFKTLGKALIIASCAVLLAFFVFPIISMFRTVNSVNIIKKDYSINELKKIESSSFKKLNEVTFPSADIKNLELDESFKESIIDFAYNAYSNLEIKDNISFSPIGLYSNLLVTSLASNNAEVLEEFDNVLGLDNEARKDNFIKMYQNDYFSNELGTIQMYNASFINSNYKVNQKYVNTLADYYTDAYQMNFASSKDVNKMLQWVDQRLNTNNFITPKELEIDIDSMIYILSTLYFNNKWSNSFISSNNYKDSFYKNGESISQVDYMRHTYFGKVYDYDKYISCFDYYCNRLKIQYIVPKDINEDILTLIDGINFLINDEDKISDNTIIDLSVPKFETTSMIDFSPIVKKMGIRKAFNDNYPAFNYAFENPTDNIYLDFIKQKNQVSFSEDGTIIRSLTFGLMKNGSAGPIGGDTYKVVLNQPFIYVIYDSQDLPLYIGYTSNI